jgi:hypothetical protein
MMTRQMRLFKIRFWSFLKQLSPQNLIIKNNILTLNLYKKIKKYSISTKRNEKQL